VGVWRDSGIFSALFGLMLNALFLPRLLIQAIYLFTKNKIISIIRIVAQEQIMPPMKAAIRNFPFLGANRRVSSGTSIFEYLP
jgi:hypothetical protein